MKKILITTTDSLYGWEIETYLKPIFASVVIGTNVFAELGASVTDFFGGRSTGYEKRLQLLKDNAIEILSSKASNLGANCILGLKVDMDEITGKGMQMFMITAVGMAVIAKNPKSQTDSKHIKEIDKDLVIDKSNILRLLGKFTNPETKITLEELQIIASSGSSEFKEFIISKVKSLGTTSLSEDEAKRVTTLYKDYFAAIDPVEAVVALYPVLLEDSGDELKKVIISIIKDNDLLDYGFVHKLLDESFDKRKTALSVLQAHKPGYAFEDIAGLEELIDHLKTSFPKVATTTMKKGFLSSNEKEVWVCPCNTSNSIDSIYCSNCFNDQYGFTQQEPKPSQYVTELTNRLLAIKDIL